MQALKKVFFKGMKESHAHASIGSETELNHINNVTRKT
jgi:hypothetical protein